MPPHPLLPAPEQSYWWVLRQSGSGGPRCQNQGPQGEEGPAQCQRDVLVLLGSLFPFLIEVKNLNCFFIITESCILFTLSSESMSAIRRWYFLTVEAKTIKKNPWLLSGSLDTEHKALHSYCFHEVLLISPPHHHTHTHTHTVFRGHRTG